MKNKKTDMKNRFADTGKSYAGYFLRFVFCLVLTAAASLAQAQNRNQVSGKVTDKAGEPLIGATVVVVGTTTGATTGADGRFTIGVPAGGELKISYIGYVEQTVKVSAQSVLDIVLEEDSQMLKDVVVIGYGTMEKKSVTSSISSIKGDDLVAGMGGSTIATALQGKIPGLTISGSASPNSSNDFQLRGVASVNASKGPLVIIDGIPGGDMRALNQEDIESVDVLKDASAGAIYGTRAAGGVILVTTKQARQGRVTARYTGEFSVEAIRKTPDLLSSSEYVEYGLGEDYGHDTDWYKELTNELPFSQRHSVSISGGSNVAQVYTSFMAQNQKGIVIGDNRKDYSGRVNAKFNLFDGVVEIRTNAQFREAERDNRNSSGIFKMAFGLNPTIPLRDPANPSNYNVVGNGISGTSFNPVADIMLRTNNGKDQWLLADATVKINLIKVFRCRVPWVSTNASISSTPTFRTTTRSRSTTAAAAERRTSSARTTGSRSKPMPTTTRFSARTIRSTRLPVIVSGRPAAKISTWRTTTSRSMGSVRGIWAWVRTSRKGVPRWTRARTRANGCSRCSAAPTIRTGTATW